jgi:group II intron reverse transcriptase/maturase
MTQGNAMYVASKPERDWLLSEQRKLYTRSRENPDYVFKKLWGLATDPRNLRCATERVARNKGRRSAGVDGITVRKLLRQGVDPLVAQLRAELRSGAYRPSPVRRVLIPKNGQPGKFRPLGIPTVKDRVVQAAVKYILEPIFEADFFPTSHGFRPGKSVHGALEHLRLLLRPTEAGPKAERRLSYQWAIEGDIKGCFDNIDHHGLMVRVRRRIGDPKLNQLVLAFLKAGVMSEQQFARSEAGTPQGGILSPLLANIALSAIDERYERHVWPRRTPTLLTEADAIQVRAMDARANDRKRGRPILFPIRYADDFIILVCAPPGPRQDERAREIALAEKDALAALLKEQLNLELSAAKTLVSPVTSRLGFLGHHACVRHHPVHGRMVSTAVVPKERTWRLRERIKALFRSSTVGTTLTSRLDKLNPMLRGFGYFYRHAWGAKRVFASIDHYVWWTIFRWLRKKHPKVALKVLFRKYARRKPGRRMAHWHDGNAAPFVVSRIRVEPFRMCWLRPPAFVSTPAESPVRIERRTPGSARGAQKPSGASRRRR